MAKFDFNNSRYAKFFGSKDNKNYLTRLVNTENIIGCNYQWYKSQGRKAANPLAVNPDGSAAFNVSCRSVEAAPLMDMRANLGDSISEDKSGHEWYTATIPNFAARGTVESAMEREYKVRMFEEFGEDADIVNDFVDIVQGKIDQADTTLNNMTAQLISTGCIDWRKLGKGIQAAVHKAPIPLENFCKAGVSAENCKVWTDKDCKILTQMQEIEAKYRDKWGTTAAFIWQMPKNIFLNVFLKNNQVVEFVKEFRKLNYVATPEEINVTEALWREAAVNLDGMGISPIVIVEEKARNSSYTGDTMVNGWNQDHVVFRPAGDAMEIQYAEVTDVRMFKLYGANGISKVFTRTNGGLATLVNTTLSNGAFKEWHTDLLMMASPALINWLYNVIVDIKRIA